MKKLILAVAAVMVSVAAFAQGQITFNNRVAGVVDARVTDAAERVLVRALQLNCSVALKERPRRL